MELGEALKTHKEKIRPAAYATLSFFSGKPDFNWDSDWLNLCVELSNTYGNLEGKINEMVKEGKFSLKYEPEKNYKTITVKTSPRNFGLLVERDWVEKVDFEPYMQLFNTKIRRSSA